MSSICTFYLIYPPYAACFTFSLHDALPICPRSRHRGARHDRGRAVGDGPCGGGPRQQLGLRSEEHTSELQSLRQLVCRLLLEKNKGTEAYSYCCWYVDTISGHGSRARCTLL